MALSGGWQWMDKSAVPGRDDNMFKAYFDVSAYERNYDFSGVEGYDPATHTAIRSVTVDIEPEDDCIFPWRIVAVVLLAALMIFFIIWKRRKDDEDENNAD